MPLPKRHRVDTGLSSGIMPATPAAVAELPLKRLAVLEPRALVARRLEVPEQPRRPHEPDRRAAKRRVERQERAQHGGRRVARGRGFECAG